MNKTNIDQPGFLRESLSQAKMPVDASVWEGISSSLSGNAAAAATTATAKSATVMSVAAKVAVAVLGVSALVATLVLTLDTSESNQTPVVKVETPLEESQEPVKEQPEEVAQADNTDKDNDPEQVQGIGSENEKSEMREEPVSQDVDNTDQGSKENQEAEIASLDVVPSTPAANSDPEPTDTKAENQSLENPAVEQAPENDATTSDVSEPIQAPEPAISPTWVDDSGLTVRFDPGIDNAVSYRWGFGDFNNSDEAIPVHQFASPGYYEVYVKVTTAEGEVQFDQITLEVVGKPLLMLPNIFTPNGDGHNDYLTVKEGAKDLEVLRVLVYDMDGSTVFDADGINEGWDGYLPDGSLAPEGNYRLVVRAEDITKKVYNESALVRLQR